MCMYFASIAFVFVWSYYCTSLTVVSWSKPPRSVTQKAPPKNVLLFHFLLYASPLALTFD